MRNPTIDMAKDVMEVVPDLGTGVPQSCMSASTPLPLAEMARLLQRVVGFYARTLRKDQAGLDFFKSRRLDDPAMLEVFQVGYCNGTLPGVLPKAGKIIDELSTLGILNANGTELFSGCVTVPVLDAAGNVFGIYGHKVSGNETRHIYLPGPDGGIWNGAAAKIHQRLFIANAILDGMVLWQAGFKNVIAIHGTNGWTANHIHLIKESGVTEVILCLGNEDSGGMVAQQLIPELLSGPIKSVHVIQWPEGIKDVVDFFLSRDRAPQANIEFQSLVQTASCFAQTKVSENPASEDIQVTSEGFTATFCGRRYDLCALEKPNPSRLKATIRAVGNHGRFVIDTLDFYLSRSRRSFISEAALLFGENVEVIESDANRLIEQLETHIQNIHNKKAGCSVTQPDSTEGIKLGRHPNLISEILLDMERLGMIGESTNNLIGYLVMTSRKMPDPLSLLTLSGSGSGKSHLQDTILCLCPDEDLIKLTSLTDRALFYKGENSLQHKVLALEELAGAQGADYAIRNLMSAKKLVMESTVKNSQTGKLESHVNTVHGPTAVFQTTTNPKINAETRSRFILVSVDESLEQTRAILDAQRRSHTLEGWRCQSIRTATIQKHQAFQRLLRPLAVVNPFEPFLSYPDEQLQVRRDHPKYLHLVLAVTFLHQLQRPVKYDEICGNYIETTLDDIAIANDLAHKLFGNSMDDLSRPARELLKLVSHYVAVKSTLGSADNIAACPPSFNRRELREAFQWGDTRLRTHLEELVEMEYILPLSGRFGQKYQYRLLCSSRDESERFLTGLKSVEQLRQELDLANKNRHLATTSHIAFGEVSHPASPNNDTVVGYITQNLALFPWNPMMKSPSNGTQIFVSAGDAI